MGEVTVNHLTYQNQYTFAAPAIATVRLWLFRILSTSETFFDGAIINQRDESWTHDCDTEKMAALLGNTLFCSQINCFSSCTECFAICTHILRYLIKSLATHLLPLSLECLIILPLGGFLKF